MPEPGGVGPQDRLTDPARLFAESVALYRARLKPLLALSALGGLAALSALLLPLGAVWALVSGSRGAWAAALGVSLSAASVLAAWAQAALVEALVAPEPVSTGACLAAAGRRLMGFLWVLGAAFLVWLGAGLCLLLPGVYMTAALALSPVVFIVEGGGALRVMGRSLELVEGRWWACAGRLLLAAAAGIVPQLVPRVGPLLSVASGPLGLAVLCRLYADLARTRPAGSAAPSPRTRLLLASGALGLGLPFLALLAQPRRLGERLEALSRRMRLASELVRDPARLEEVLGALPDAPARARP